MKSFFLELFDMVVSRSDFPQIAGRGLIAVVSCCLIFPVAVTAGVDVEQEVGYLLEYVEDSECTFFRNGKPYTSEEAREHLEYKYNRVRSRIHSAELFIDRIATRSSLSGKVYEVKCQETYRESGKWLNDALRSLRTDTIEELSGK